MMGNQKLAAYLRDSGGDEQDLSIDQQLIEIERWCSQNSVSLIKTFVDEARPGSSTVGRSAFHEMMSYFRSDDCEASGLDPLALLPFQS